MCAKSPGNRRAAAARLTAGDSRNLAAQGRRRAGAGHCGGPGRPLDPSRALAAGPGTVPHPRDRDSPTPPRPTRCPAGAAPSVFAAPARPGASPARTPPAPGLAAPPPGGPILRLAPQRQPPPALPQPRCGQTDRRAGGQGQQGPRRAGARGTRHRRSLARAAAAESRRAPLGSPITQLASPASRATEGGSPGDPGAATGEERLSLALAPPRTAAVRLLSVRPLQAPPAAAGLGHRPKPGCRASPRSALAPATDTGSDQSGCRAPSDRPIAGGAGEGRR